MDTGDAGDVGSVPGSGRSPGGGHGDPLQYSCLGKPVDRGAWRRMGTCGVHGVAKEPDMTEQLSMRAHAIKTRTRCIGALT